MTTDLKIFLVSHPTRAEELVNIYTADICLIQNFALKSVVGLNVRYIYIYIYSNSNGQSYIYIYIYICVCVCMCVFIFGRLDVINDDCMGV